MHSPVVVKQVHELKDTQKGVELMCHEMEKIYSEGMESGELKKAKETALSMAEKGMDVFWCLFFVVQKRNVKCAKKQEGRKCKIIHKR